MLYSVCLQDVFNIPSRPSSRSTKPPPLHLPKHGPSSFLPSSTHKPAPRIPTINKPIIRCNPLHPHRQQPGGPLRTSHSSHRSGSRPPPETARARIPPRRKRKASRARPLHSRSYNSSAPPSPALSPHPDPCTATWRWHRSRWRRAWSGQSLARLGTLWRRRA